jgi:hypothetical protein
LVAEAAIKPAGVVPKWQVSQLLPDGMCELAPAGEVAGITTILLIPVKLLAVMLGPWQASQLVVMPVWLIREPLNLAPLSTGVVAMLEPVPTWQLSQAALVGTWAEGKPTMLKPTAGIAKLAAALPWHCAQLVVVLCAFAWILVSVGVVAKSPGVVWQDEHCAAVAYGMWFDGSGVAEK